MTVVLGSWSVLVDWTAVLLLAWSLSDDSVVKAFCVLTKSVEIRVTELYDSVVTLLVTTNVDALDEMLNDKEDVSIVVVSNISPISLVLVPFSQGGSNSSSLHLSLHQPQLSPRTST